MVYTRSDHEIDIITRSCQIVADTLEMLSELEHTPPSKDIWDILQLFVYLWMMQWSMGFQVKSICEMVRL